MRCIWEDFNVFLIPYIDFVVREHHTALTSTRVPQLPSRASFDHRRRCMSFPLVSMCGRPYRIFRVTTSIYP